MGQVPIEFKWKSGGTSVYVAGSWDGWQDKIKLNHNVDGSFLATIDLRPGEHQYKYIVDGAWRQDSTKKECVSDNLGGYNNILTVESKYCHLGNIIWLQFVPKGASYGYKSDCNIHFPMKIQFLAFFL